MTNRRRVTRYAAVLLAVFMTATACMEQRPPEEAWQSQWVATVERVHSADLESISEGECEDIHAFLRERKPELSPPPVDDLQEPVAAWFTEAEGMFFNCEFPDTALQKMEGLETEIEQVIGD